MKLSRSIGYAITALDNIYRQHPQPVAARAIAVKHKIPVEYLQKVLQLLVRNHILDAVRGPQGGFSLARPAARINLYDIYVAVEGELAVEPGQFPGDAPQTTVDQTVAAYAAAQEQVRKQFRKVTLVTLAGKTAASRPASAQSPAKTKKR